MVKRHRQRQRGGSTASNLVNNLVQTVNSPLAYNTIGGVPASFSDKCINQPASSFNYAQVAQVAPAVQTGGKRGGKCGGKRYKKSMRKRKTKTQKLVYSGTKVWAK